MQILFTYAPVILAAIGASVCILEYYLGLTCRENCAHFVGSSLVFAIACYFLGILIQKLRLSSHTDFLTGLWNRRYFYSKLDKEKAWASRKKTPRCVAMIDVDDFKTINDTYGHAVGDLLLSDLASIFKKYTRDKDTVIRWGGDEFAIVFVDTSLENALGIMDRIRLEVQAKYSVSYRLTISAGITTIEPAKELKELLIRVDNALYRAKNKKNLVIVMDDV